MSNGLNRSVRDIALVGKDAFDGLVQQLSTDVSFGFGVRPAYPQGSARSSGKGWNGT